MKSLYIYIIRIVFVSTFLSCSGIGIKGLAGDHICGHKYKKLQSNIQKTKRLKMVTDCKKIAELNCIWTGNDKFMFDNVIDMEVISYGGDSYSIDKSSRKFEQKNNWFFPKPSYRYGIDYNGFIYNCKQ